MEDLVISVLDHTGDQKASEKVSGNDRKRLVRYDRLREQGRLPELPCRPDEAVYVVETDESGAWEQVHKDTVKCFGVFKDKICVLFQHLPPEPRDVSEFGTLIFKSEKELINAFVKRRRG